ncbi:MAG: UbiA-like polyprenyltransferase [Desulfobulbus sp.]
MWKNIAILLEMIKFEHTIFALPLALQGAFLAAGGVPGALIFFWVIVAMAGARTCAMGFNRIADRRFDAANPRTANRALPAGEVSLTASWAMVLVSGAVFFFACAMLNPLALKLSPLALGLTLVYSLTKRFTWLCHVVLGIAEAFAPMGGWVAVTGSLIGFPWMLSAAVLFWVAGFDCVYACMDAEFDRKAGLHSMPACFGRRTGFRIAGFFHLLAFLLYTWTGVYMGLNGWYYAGIVLTAAALLYQHAIVSPQDLSRIHQSFFSMNGLISVTLFFATWLALATAS